jgi:hypothetical protein
MPALDFTAMMSAAAALEADLAAKDAIIAELAAEHAAMAAQLEKVWTRAERLAAANDTLKNRVAALDALLSARAVAAEQQAFDDLLCPGSDSVLAEEAYAAAAAAQQQQYDDPTGVFAEAEEAEEVLDLTGDSEGEAAPAAEGGAAPAAKKARADPRIFSKLAAVLPEGTPLSLNTSDLRWDGVYTKGGLVFQGRVFKSPYAVCRAHAQRITERHPNATKPGSGWKWLEIQHGPFKGKKLGEAYDAHYA